MRAAKEAKRKQAQKEIEDAKKKKHDRQKMEEDKRIKDYEEEQ
jgi:hypothetical protein